MSTAFPNGQPAQEWAAITHRFSVSGHVGHISVATDEHDRPVLLEIRMAKAGGLLRGLLNSLAASVSLGLQRGVPLPDYVSLLSLTRFEPAGWTERMGYAHSVVDYLFRWLGEKFPGVSAIDPAPAVADGETCAVCGTPATWSPGSPCPECGDIGLVGTRPSSRTAAPSVGRVTAMRADQGAPALGEGSVLEWLPAERLEDGLEAREILARGHAAGMLVHKSESQPKRNVLLGPIGQALGSPSDWLDGLEPDQAVEMIVQAAALLPPEDLEQALSAWQGVAVANE